MTADLTAAAALAALSERRAKVEGATMGPWGGPEVTHGGKSGALELHRVFSVSTRETGEFADEVADCLDAPDAALIVQMHSDYEALLSIGLAVIERHAPRIYRPPYSDRNAHLSKYLCRRCPQVAWPCAEVKPWLELLGVGEGE